MELFQQSSSNFSTYPIMRMYMYHYQWYVRTISNRDLCVCQALKSLICSIVVLGQFNVLTCFFVFFSAITISHVLNYVHSINIVCSCDNELHMWKRIKPRKSHLAARF